MCEAALVVDEQVFVAINLGMEMCVVAVGGQSFSQISPVRFDLSLHPQHMS